MAAKDADLVQAMGATSWTADDGSSQSDLTTEASNDTTGSGINVASASKIGKGGSPHGDVLRVAYDTGFGGLADGDTITVEVESIHNVDDLSMLAYTDANTVTTTDKVLVTGISTGAVVFTITTAFITALNELGTDGFAVRITEDGGTGGDWQLSEVDADLTAGNGDTTLTADPGALTLTGATANFGASLGATLGALILTGAVANFSIGLTLDAQPGVLTLTGATATLDATLDAQPGALTLTGANAEFVIGLVLTADPGALTLTGATANFGAGLDAQPGALTLTGATALFAGAELDAQPGALTLTGATAGLDTTLAAASTQLTLTGAVANFATGLTLDAQPGVLTLTGAEADLIATGLVVRRGGVRFLLEPDPEKREGKKRELAALLKPAIPAKSAAGLPQVPQKTLMEILSTVTSPLPPAQQTRADRLLQETGISMEELLVILSIS